MLGSVRLKVVIENGVVSDVYADDDRIPIDIEVIDVDTKMIDFPELVDYRNSIRRDPDFKNIGFCYAEFILDAMAREEKEKGGQTV